MTFSVLKFCKSTDVKERQSWNILDIFVTFEVSKLKSILTKDGECKNNPDISSTLLVWNPEISNFLKDKQLLNTFDIFITLSVLKFVKLIDVKKLVPWNILDISFKLLVTSFDKSNSLTCE